MDLALDLVQNLMFENRYIYTKNVYSSPKNLSYKFIKYLEQSTKAIVEWSTS